MREAGIHIGLGVLCFSVFPALHLCCGTYECLHAHLALHSASIIRQINNMEGTGDGVKRDSNNKRSSHNLVKD
jgi:hypothetical protein